jgi:hypothetical protein
VRGNNLGSLERLNNPSYNSQVNSGTTGRARNNTYDQQIGSKESLNLKSLPAGAAKRNSIIPPLSSDAQNKVILPALGSPKKKPVQKGNRGLFGLGY